MNTFAEYIAKRRVSNNASGAFVLDARSDPAMKRIESWPALQAHLFRRHGEHVKPFIDAAEPVWQGYRAHVLKSRRT